MTVEAEAGTHARVRQFTGARTRVVWCQQAGEAGDDVFGRGRELQLWGYDSEDGRGAQVILDTFSNYHRPMITPKGDRIIYNHLPQQMINVVDWNGSGWRSLTNGIAVDVWRDPATGIEWVYRMEKEIKEFQSGPLTRFQLDNPAVSEMVLNRADITWDNVQLSADGTRASGQFPHPRAGFARVPDGEVSVLGRGCWTSLAPDNSYLSWIFDGPHRNLHLHAPDGRSWTVNINHAPGIDGYEVYHPRWSNHARFLAITGPYKTGDIRKNLIYFGGPAVEVYLGRFSPDFTRVEEWFRLTDNQRADFFPDVWIEGGETAEVALVPREDPAPKTESAPAAKAVPVRVRLEGRLVAATPTPSVVSISPYTQALVTYVYEVVQVHSGECDAPKILVAHWAIRDRQVLDLGKEPGGTYALELELFSDHPELEGERLLMETDEFDLPFYYEPRP
ncbi:MAG TPA: hypothetical protein DCM68_01945 [Verrucomicrobia bacterium]|nr:hypothetical protein [Verrucomicrobiota bacterium]